MRAKWLHPLILVTVALCFAGQQPKPPSNPATSASGVFLGRSGKPMAGARLILCEAREDLARIRILANVPTATTDQQGQFTIRGFEPGRWTIIYLPAGFRAAIPNEIDFSALEAVDRCPFPLLVRVELGKDTPYEARPWSSQFTLLKGHTFWSLGAQMKVWNATVRRGPQGPFLELRRGRVWLTDFEDKRQVRFESWSY
ncbi:MAG: carboxypeptidase regulatory-like domain-containing protein [Acidobacteria bacterium]|nr:carboxypeptidase regulatory-like domain-containing protein [Acidobacteriota bacterium]